MKPSLQKYFGVLRDNLSVRARHILDAYKISDVSTLLTKRKDPGFSFLNMRNCGKVTADELDGFVSQLLNYQKELIESHASATENTIYTITGDEYSNNSTDASIRKPISDFGLSSRTLNGLRKKGVKTFGDLVSINKNDLFNIPGFGQKSQLEIENIVLSYRLNLGIDISSYYPPNEKTQDVPYLISNIPCNRYLSNTDIDFSYTFKDKYGHFPMAFISYRTLSFLTEYEREVLRMTIEPLQPLSLEEIANKFCLTRERIRQIYDKARKRIKSSSTIEQLFQNEDWGVYGVGDDVSFVFPSDLHIDRIIEERDFLIEYNQNRGNDDWNTPNITESSLYFVLVMKGMIPLWMDQEKKELSSYYIASEQTAPFFFVDDRLNQYKFNKVIREVHRLQKIRKTGSVCVPITSYFIDNNCYWNGNSKPSGIEIDKFKELLIRVLQVVCGIHAIGESIVFECNKLDYCDLIYKILNTSGRRLHRDELLKRLKEICNEKNINCKFADSKELTPFLSRNPHIVPVGKSGFWELKEWGDYNGSIREIAIDLVGKAKAPIQIDGLCKKILKHRPDSNKKSISSVIRQTISSGELILYFDNYIGHPKRKYDDDYILMPQLFDEWMQSFKTFVLENKRFPFSNQKGYEGYLYRWYYKANRLTHLSSEEIIKFDALEKELAHYPQNPTEYNYLQKCNLYKKYVEGNRRNPTQDDDPELFNWFYAASRNYKSIKGNRYIYFSQLLQSLSKILI